MIKFENNDSQSQWLSISDLMSVLMMIFLVISVISIHSISKQKDHIQEIAEELINTKESLISEINEEFKNDFIKWEAEFDEENLTIKFLGDTKFETNKSEPLREFKEIIEDFWPRFYLIISSEKYSNEITNIEIEGHTDHGRRSGSDCTSQISICNYTENMELSQDRSRNVLDFILNLSSMENESDFNWTLNHIKANGLSFSHLLDESGNKIEKISAPPDAKIIDQNEIIDKKSSRRVEFKINLNSEGKIYKILTEK